MASDGTVFVSLRLSPVIVGGRGLAVSLPAARPRKSGKLATASVGTRRFGGWIRLVAGYGGVGGAVGYIQWLRHQSVGGLPSVPALAAAECLFSLSAFPGHLRNGALHLFHLAQSGRNLGG